MIAACDFARAPDVGSERETASRNPGIDSVTIDMLEISFAQPGYLLTLLAIPVALVFFLYAYLRRRRSLRQLGSPLVLRKGILLKPRICRWKMLCLLSGLFLAALACARPQWGHDPTPQHRTGRDVILVLDLSRSMLAEQPSRRELAIRALRHLADTFEEDGGNRVAVVLFAAQARLLFPLTQDYDHLRHALTQIENNDYPSLTGDSLVSGTRIGAALKLAVQACDPERANRPVLVLLSDGDDPMGDDEEWLSGVMAATKQQLRIHTVGIGDPEQAHTIPHGKERLEFEGKPIRTKLNEQRLQEIAERTGGVYLAAHTQTLLLGAFMQHLLDADALHEEVLAENAPPVYQQRYAWFLLPAVLLFMLTLVLNEGPRSSWTWPWRFPMPLAKLPTLILIVTAAVLISAAPAPPPTQESLLRQGNEAFAHQDYTAALKYYEEAGPLTLDPGQLEFNKAAAYYRLGKYREAIASYRRCLEDDQAPPTRRARAYFDLGNALLQQAGNDPQLLAEAATAYRSCLQQGELPAALRTDARHNLELAQLLWLRALAQQQPPGKKDKEDNSTSPPQTHDKVSLSEPNDPMSENGKQVPVEPKDGSKTGKISGTKAEQKARTLKSGQIQVLPDQDALRPMSKEDTLATLEEAARRIAEQRRQQRRPVGPVSLATKDW